MTVLRRSGVVAGLRGLGQAVPAGDAGETTCNIQITSFDNPHWEEFKDRLMLRWGEARISESAVDLAMLLAALATPAIYLGWQLAGTLNLGRALPHPRLDVPALPLRLVGTGIVALSLLTDVLWMRRELTVYQPAVSVIAVLTPSDLGFAMVLLPTLRRQDGGRRGKLLFWGLFGAAAVIALMRGVLTPLMKPLLIYVLANLVICRRARMWPVVAALTVVEGAPSAPVVLTARTK